LKVTHVHKNITLSIIAPDETITFLMAKPFDATPYSFIRHAISSMKTILDGSPDPSPAPILSRPEFTTIALLQNTAAQDSTPGTRHLIQ
jgi:hypothetical protein